jgi:transposase
MAMTTLAQQDQLGVTVGVDTHRDQHVAVALDHLGRRLGELSVPTEPAGYADLLSWAESFGAPEAFGIEGTASYGAGLTRWLRARGLAVIEVNRPNRQARRRMGKSDPADAEAAARAVLSGEASATPKTGDDQVESIRMLRIARAGANKARTAAINALKGLIVTSPEALAAELKGLSTRRLVDHTARFRPGPLISTTAGAKAAMASIARRIKELETEIAALNADLEPLVAEACPALIALYGVGTDSAGTLLVSAGDNPDRLSSEGSAAKLWGVAPIEASSGLTKRHRLNRGGDRQANAALYRIVIVRMHHHQPTRDYVERRIKEGKSKREIMRCLKRYVVREVYSALTGGDGSASLEAA